MPYTEKTIKSEPLYDAGFFKMHKDVVETRNGQSVRILIDHNGAVAIAALTPENKLLMVKQYRKAYEKVLLEIPAGKIDDYEVIAEGKEPCSRGTEGFIDNSLPAAIRELSEETGWEAEDWRKLTTIYTAVGFTNEHVDIYACRAVKKGEAHFDGDEDLDILEVPLNEALRMVLSGEIEDCKTAVAVLMTAREKGI